MTKDKLRPAAFKEGQILEYVGKRYATSTINGKEVPAIHKGMQVTIIEVHPPIKGLGFIGYDEDGEEIIDRDSDGYNVYVNKFGYRRIIWPKDKNEWIVI